MSSPPRIKVEKMDLLDGTEDIPLLDCLKEEKEEIHFDAPTSQRLPENKAQTYEESSFNSCTEEEEVYKYYVLHIKCLNEMKLIKIEKDAFNNRQYILEKISKEYPFRINCDRIKTNLGALLPAEFFLTALKQFINSASFYLEVEKAPEGESHQLFVLPSKRLRESEYSSSCTSKRKNLISTTSHKRRDTVPCTFTSESDKCPDPMQLPSPAIDTPGTLYQIQNSAAATCANEFDSYDKSHVQLEPHDDSVGFFSSVLDDPDGTLYEIRDLDSTSYTNKCKSQSSNGESMDFTSRDNDPNKMKIKSLEKKSLFNGYFYCNIEMLSANGGISALCMTCKRKIKGFYGVTSNFTKHLKRSHPQMYALYEQYPKNRKPYLKSSQCKKYTHKHNEHEQDDHFDFRMLDSPPKKL